MQKDHSDEKLNDGEHFFSEIRLETKFRFFFFLFLPKLEAIICLKEEKRQPTELSEKLFSFPPVPEMNGALKLDSSSSVFKITFSIVACSVKRGQL